ncbi:hypothetical protein CHUAL_012503 [Chamberlinius hualienensis]
MKIAVVAAVLLFLIHQNEAFTCRPCVHERDCKNEVKSETECQHGIVTDACDCCKVCAKGPGESCGGIFHVGKCGKGMSCVEIVNNPTVTTRPIPTTTTPPPHLTRKCVVDKTTTTIKP